MTAVFNRLVRAALSTVFSTLRRLLGVSQEMT
jgi:hypothetical protein